MVAQVNHNPHIVPPSLTDLGDGFREVPDEVVPANRFATSQGSIEYVS